MPHRRTEEYFKSLEAHVAAQVRAMRLRKGLTQAQVAERAEVTDKFVSRVETAGENLSLHSVGAIARALGCQPGDLLPRSGEAPSNGSKLAVEAKALLDALDSNPKRRRHLRLIARILADFFEYG